ncbi:Peptidyl-prolyl cis-trans isomerase FKBP4 [Folsomia candida]|uniref:peptidylprolyl isomerase n=1 Tax=Folsomia candida TaxID=158441 RepID=A0A226E882_FOLCA|nr:Peptidyl-prolyl cis-trans isomerase FKBP4 [Folsomia candida]
MDVTAGDDAVFQLLGVRPGPDAVDISPLGDQKLWREVLFTPESTGDEEQDQHGARNGMEVKVHYKGTLTDNSIFDENTSSDPPFTFTIGEGKVISGWERGVVGMKRGQKIKLICHPSFAYDARETGGIPANSTLIFEANYSPEDLTKKKNGNILRYNIKEGGSKYLNPNHGSIVEVLIRGKYNDIVVYPETTKKFRLGEGCEHEIPYGVEKALYKFRSGEGSILIIRGQKYGSPAVDYEAHGISPDSPLEFYVEVLSHENSKEPWQLEGPEKVEISRTLKELGNKFYAKSNYRVAFKNYKLIIDHLKAEALLHGEEEEERKALMLAANLNMAICNLKLNRPTIAIRNCDDALDLNANNTKALFRRGLANLAVNLPDAAKRDFEKVIQLEPNNSTVTQQLAICDKMIKENLKKEKQMYTKMFSSAGQKPKTETPLPNGMDNVSEWQQKPEANGRT